MKICFVTIYPPRGEKYSKSDGVAVYSKNLANALLSNNKNTELVVLAEKQTCRTEYYENDVKVIRCWNRGFFYPIQIFRGILRHGHKLDVIHVQHEPVLYGSGLLIALFPVMLLLLKLLREPIVVTMHATIPLSKLNDTFMKENYLKTKPSVLRLGILIMTKLISYFADKVIVHEPYFGKVLVEEYGIAREKISIIPHGIEEVKESINPEKAKEILGVKGKKTLLFFGYITNYKGLHILIDSFRYLTDKNLTLLVVGGENLRLQGKPKFERYVHSLKKRASHISNQIRFLGFVPEKMVPLCFSAADLMVLPYTTIMSTSGPLMQCIAYKRPFLLSEAFKDVINNIDVLFNNNSKDLAKKIEKSLSEEEFKIKSQRTAEILLQASSWSSVACKTANLYREVNQCTQ